MKRRGLWIWLAGTTLLATACADKKTSPEGDPAAPTKTGESAAPATPSPAETAPAAAVPSRPGAAQPAGAQPAAAAGAAGSGPSAGAPGLTPLAEDPDDHAGTHRWSRRIGSPGTDAARDVAIDAQGQVAVCGYHATGVDVGAGEPIEAQAFDAFVSLYGPGGERRWSLHFGGPGEDVSNAVAFDPAGNLVLAGLFSDKVSIGDIPLQATGSDDIFVAKLDPAGTPLWAYAIGGFDSDGASDVAVGADGSIYLTGSFKGTMKVAGEELASTGNEDILVLALTPAGDLSWIKRYGHRYRDFGQRLAVDGEGHLVLLAEFTDEVDLGGERLVSEGNRDLAVAKFTARGEHVWSRRFGSPFNEFGLGLAVDPAGGIGITGSFDNEIDFGGGKLTSAGESDIYVAKLGPDGSHAWSQRFGGAREDIGYGLAADRYGNLVVTGWFWGEVDFGGGARRANGVNKDIFLLKLSASGAHQWSHRFGGPDHDQGRGVAVTPAGDVALAGIFRFDLKLGGEPLQSAREATDRAPPPDVFTAVFSR